MSSTQLESSLSLASSGAMAAGEQFAVLCAGAGRTASHALSGRIVCIPV